MQALGWMSALAGLALAAFGGVILLTGKAPSRTRRAFRRVQEAGLYAACTGSALVLLTVASTADRLDDVLQLGLLAVAMTLFIVAFVRYRPRNDAGRHIDR